MDTKSFNKDLYEDIWKSASVFTRISPGFKWMFGMMDMLFREIYQESIDTLLDVGCGEGTKTFFLKSRFSNATVLGIDFSSSGIEQAKTRLTKNPEITNVDFRCVDANELTVWNMKYDMISCFEVLEHVDDWRSLVSKFASCSNKYVLLSFPTGRMRKYDKKMGHVRNFKKNEIENYFAELNFKPVQVYYAGFPFYNPLGRDVLDLVYDFQKKHILYANKQTLLTKLYSSIIYFLLEYCSTKKNFGNQFIGLFQRVSG